jgi:DNA invertase Pin-like site-specific DNA recombinase
MVRPIMVNMCLQPLPHGCINFWRDLHGRQKMPRGINKIEAIAYLRTSSMTNVGADKDSAKRQRAAIQAHAKAAGYVLVAEYADEGVSGADPIEARPGFVAMLAHIAGNGVRVVLVETANRFARDLMTQELGYSYLQRLGVTLIAADSPNSFVDDGPTATMVRQILGAVSQFEKSGLVAKLKAARDRKRIETGKKCGGRKTYAERDPAMVSLAKSLTKKGLSLRQVAMELERAGHVQKNGWRYTATAIKRMVSQGKGNAKA